MTDLGGGRDGGCHQAEGDDEDAQDDLDEAQHQQDLQPGPLDAEVGEAARRAAGQRVAGVAGGGHGGPGQRAGATGPTAPWSPGAAGGTTPGRGRAAQGKQERALATTRPGSTFCLPEDAEGGSSPRWVLGAAPTATQDPGLPGGPRDVPGGQPASAVPAHPNAALARASEPAWSRGPGASPLSPTLEPRVQAARRWGCSARNKRRCRERGPRAVQGVPEAAAGGRGELVAALPPRAPEHPPEAAGAGSGRTEPRAEPARSGALPKKKSLVSSASSAAVTGGRAVPGPPAPAAGGGTARPAGCRGERARASPPPRPPGAASRRAAGRGAGSGGRRRSGRAPGGAGRIRARSRRRPQPRREPGMRRPPPGPPLRGTPGAVVREAPVRPRFPPPLPVATQRRRGGVGVGLFLKLNLKAAWRSAQQHGTGRKGSSAAPGQQEGKRPPGPSRGGRRAEPPPPQQQGAGPRGRHDPVPPPQEQQEGNQPHPLVDESRTRGPQSPGPLGGTGGWGWGQQG